VRPSASTSRSSTARTWPPPLLLLLLIHCVVKSVSNIIDCNLKKNYPILMIFVRIFLTQLAIKWQFMFPPHPMCASALPGESRTSEICIKINKKMSKKFLALSIVTWRTITRFWYLFIQIFMIELVIEWPFMFPPHPTSASALPRQNITRETSVGMNKKVNKFHLSVSVAPYSRSITRFDCHAAVCLPDDV